MLHDQVGLVLSGSLWEVRAEAPLSLPAHAEPQFAITLFSSVSGNDSCGVDTDARYNDTDLCWGPLRRVDVYRIYLVSVLSPAGARKASVNGRKHSNSFLSGLSPWFRERVLHSATLWLRSEVLAAESRVAWSAPPGSG